MTWPCCWLGRKTSTQTKTITKKYHTGFMLGSGMKLVDIIWLCQSVRYFILPDAVGCVHLIIPCHNWTFDFSNIFSNWLSSSIISSVPHITVRSWTVVSFHIKFGLCTLLCVYLRWHLLTLLACLVTLLLRFWSCLTFLGLDHNSSPLFVLIFLPCKLYGPALSQL